MPQTLNEWVKRFEVDAGVREGVTTSEAQRVKDLEREVGTAPGQRDTEAGPALFARRSSTADSSPEGFHRQATRYLGVEPICGVLQVARLGIGVTQRCDASLTGAATRSARRDLVPQIERVWQANMRVYGADKVWRQLGREGRLSRVARSSV